MHRAPFPSAARLARAAARSGVLGLLAVLASSDAAWAQKLCFSAVIDGAQETPPNASAGKGTGSFVLDRGANTLDFEITMDGLGTAETMAHIHGFAPPGTPAGIKFTLPLGAHKVGTWTFVEADEASIIAGLTYVNIHTMGFGAGEIRGQIVRDDSPVSMDGVIDGLQETPPSGSAGIGTGYYAIDTVLDTLTFNITVTGLGTAETMAHIHGYAPPGTPAGIKFTLPLGNHKVGVWSYPPAEEASILAGLAYVNIHTMGFGAGEIRGQIVPSCTNPSSYCTAKTNSSGCTPLMAWSGLPSASAGSGFSVEGHQVLPTKAGLLFYSTSGPNSAPFQGGHLCALPPTKRTALQTSSAAGGPPCTGIYALDFNVRIASGVDPALVAGRLVYGQWWTRDSGVPSATGLTNGIQFAILP